MRIAGPTPPPASIDELIEPRLAARLDALDLATNKIFAGKLQGERRSKRRGQSVEFDEHRQYAPGDDVRFIDWKALARLDKLVIKLFLEEQDLALHIALDASPSMDAGLAEPPADDDQGKRKPTSKRHLAAQIAAAVGYIGLVKNNRVGLSIFGLPGRPNIARLPDTRGKRHIQQLTRHIINNAFQKPGEQRQSTARSLSLDDALRQIAAERAGKGVTIVLSDFLDPDGYQQGLRALTAAKAHDTYAVQILSPGELDPASLSRDGSAGLTGDVRLTDVETGRSKEVTVTPQLIKRYRRALDSHIQSLHTFCLKRGIDHILVRSDEPADRLVLETLRKHGAVR